MDMSKFDYPAPWLNSKNLQHLVAKIAGWFMLLWCLPIDLRDTWRPCSLPYIPTRRDVAQVRKTIYIPLVKGWLRTCQQNHPECTKRRTELPSRVIDVGDRPGEELSLCVTKHGSAPYIALSHCWGGPELPKTTRENYASRQKVILLKELPRSFQDAVHVTRGLGFRYLWIDSLCVIQGDKDDWEVESSRMAQVYNDAVLVIGADQAKDSTQGFLFTGRYCPNKDGTWSNVHSRQFKLLHRDLCRVSPLATRGWTLQEQFLSRRMVHFVGRELVWECRTAAWCECMEIDNMQKDDMDRSGETLGQKHRLESDLSKDKGLWHSMIQQYHARDLTYPSDFLSALSGIATYLQQQYSAGKYCAGLWGPSLGELLWYNETGNARRAMPYRAPT
ncbi:heterokaryon incompatibility protein-domain-containing protein [Cenococcum geophilum]